MSLELHVFFHGDLPTKPTLNAAMKELGFPLAVTPARGTLESHEGFLPMRWRREETGVEFNVYSDPAALAEIRPHGVDPHLDRSANFRWGGDEKELLAAQSLAAAIAKLTGGVVFDPEGGRLQSLDELLAEARTTLAELRASTVRDARKSDLKRYLKPLLNERPDLMLRRGLLLFRPMRHLLRGVRLAAWQEWFQIHPFVLPLYEEPSFLGFGTPLRLHWRITSAAPLHETVLKGLNTEMFGAVGDATTLLDYADWVQRGVEQHIGLGDSLTTRLTCYVLAGRRDRAEAYVEETAADPSYRAWVPDMRALLSRDITSVCAEYHAKEAETAKALKLGDAWQPSPFSVEVAPDERESKTHEARFTAEPWPGAMG